MKKILGNIGIFLVGCLTVTTVSSCHTESGTETAKQTEVVVKTANHTIKGSIFDQNGAKLNGATVTINGKSFTVSGNTFESGSLSNGTYVVTVSKEGYKAGNGSDGKYVFTALYEVVDGKSIPVSQVAEGTFYLYKVEEATVKIGNTEQSEEIVLETSQQDMYGDGEHVVGNTRDPQNPNLNTSISVKINVPGMTNDQIKKLETQLPTGSSINDFSLKLENITTLDQAYSYAATRAATTIVAGEELPGKLTFFTGFNVIPNYELDLTDMGGVTVQAELELPDEDMKKPMKLFRLENNSWVEVTSNTTGKGISSIDFNTSGKIIVSLNVLKKQAFVLGAQIEMEEKDNQVETFDQLKFDNNTNSATTVNALEYEAKTPGIVITNTGTSAMVDYLRKAIISYYNKKSIPEASVEKLTYTFPSTYLLPAGGQIYMKGEQPYKVTSYSVKNSDASFDALEYGNMKVIVYSKVPGSDEPIIHNGGTND